MSLASIVWDSFIKQMYRNMQEEFQNLPVQTHQKGKKYDYLLTVNLKIYIHRYIVFVCLCYYVFQGAFTDKKAWMVCDRGKAFTCQCN